MKTGEVNYLDEVKNHYNHIGLDAERYTWEVREGRGRYNKVVASDIAPFGCQRHAVAFIDKQTGRMFKAASWSAPAKTRLV